MECPAIIRSDSSFPVAVVLPGVLITCRGRGYRHSMSNVWRRRRVSNRLVRRKEHSMETYGRSPMIRTRLSAWCGASCHTCVTDIQTHLEHLMLSQYLYFISHWRKYSRCTCSQPFLTEFSVHISRSNSCTRHTIRFAKLLTRLFLHYPRIKFIYFLPTPFPIALASRQLFEPP